MDPKPGTAPTPVSLPKLLAMFFSPLALRHLLETPPPSGDVLETTGVRYRNSLFLFRHLDDYVNRSGAVAAGCFFAFPILAALPPVAPLGIAVTALMLIAVVHAVALGVYRQVLSDRIDRYAGILGVQRPDRREEPVEFPVQDLEGNDPPLRATRKLPLRKRRTVRPPR
ncbi:MAG: hypothetical protein P1P84_07770 [Deferrisomatales bacterium]|nr:hypothetical protein [Deferrisomatales bacterium]